MGEGSVETLTKRSIFQWTIGVQALQDKIKLAQAEGRKHTFRSALFDGEWCLQLDVQVNPLKPRSYQHCGVFLRQAVPLVPRSDVSITIAFSLASDPERPITHYGGLSSDWTFTSTRPVCGWQDILPFSSIEPLPSKDDLLFTVTLAEGPQPTPARIPVDFFDSSTHCDVAFTFSGPEPPILALKSVLIAQSQYFETLFASDFAEGSADYDMPPVAHCKWSTLCQGDLDELPEFTRQGSAKTRKTSRAAAQKLSASLSWPTPSRAELSAAYRGQSTSRSVSGDEQMADEGGSKLESPALLLKKWHRVQVGGCSWVTFHAFLWWLYCSEVRFAPSRAAIFGALDLNPNLDIQDSLPPHWEVVALDRTGPQYACDPHALYRLADRYLEVGLRDIAKKHILSTLTPTTAAYEAFSSLSRTFRDIQDGVVIYILKHLNEVTKSPGWLRALELADKGSLPEGAGVVNNILISQITELQAFLVGNSSRQTVAA